MSDNNKGPVHPNDKKHFSNYLQSYVAIQNFLGFIYQDFGISVSDISASLEENVILFEELEKVI